jgi:Icc-related predicted phosphoesterase
MKIITASDTHLTTRLGDAPPGDMFIHSGDALNSGSMRDLIQFKSDLLGIADRYKYILFTPGNHDCIFEEDFDLARKALEEVPGLIVLHDKAVTIEGLKFYGTSWQPFFYKWAFNVGEWKTAENGRRFNWTDAGKLEEHYSRIPEDTDVLITHCPAYGILDSVGDPEKSGRRTGSPELRDRITKLSNLKLHVFGHIHFSHGVFKNGDTTFVNAAICTEDYDPDQSFIEVEIDRQLELFP